RGAGGAAQRSLRLRRAHVRSADRRDPDQGAQPPGAARLAPAGGPGAALRAAPRPGHPQGAGRRRVVLLEKARRRTPRQRPGPGAPARRHPARRPARRRRPRDAAPPARRGAAVGDLSRALRAAMVRANVAMRRAYIFVLWLLLPLCAGAEAAAFTHVVQKGDTLAGIAERYYGRIQYEQLLVAANLLDSQGGSPIRPGMRLEIPALGHRRVHKTDTWASLAQELLGQASRSDVLAIANGTNPWLPPPNGAEIVVPYNLTL